MVGDFVRSGLSRGLIVGVAVLGTAFPMARAQSVAVGAGSESVKLASVSVDVVDVPLADVLMAIAQQAGLKASWSGNLMSAGPRVSLRVRNVSADIAFAKALSGTGLTAIVVANHVDFVKSVASASVARGGVAGKIVDAKTKLGLRGATVTLDDAAKGTMSGEDGGFRMPNVVPGEHTLCVRMLGYVKATKTITVVDGQTTSADIALESSVSALDQVVVTGTVTPTQLKAVPNAITVITAKEIEERGITKIDQLFRGDVPGLFALNQGSGALLDEVRMFSRGATALSAASFGVSTLGVSNTNPIKTYIDGVEMADPQYLSQIDPKSIERIEILTGPQASTIYGSNAINGVMQIFTKRGATSHPQLTLNLMSGVMQNNFSNAKTPQHDYSAQLNGVEGRLSYSGGGSWNYVGPWTPAKQTTRTNAFGGARLDLPTELGRVTADVTLRRSFTQNQSRGSTAQTSTGYQEVGWYKATRLSGLASLGSLGVHALTGQTLGLVLGYTPTNWWSHELGIGNDVSDMEQRSTGRMYTTSYDTTLGLQQDQTVRRSLHYTTTARISVTSYTQATITAGADGWQSLTSSWSVAPQTLTGPLSGTTIVSRQPEHNTGAFVQAQLGVRDMLFFTYGLRAEWNPDYGEDAQPNYAPRYGIAYTRDIGAVTAKLRASYGRSTRPPRAGYRETETAADFYGPSWAYNSPYWPNFDYQVANPELTPEHQQGGEGGVELYLGTRGSLVITRFNQTVDRLISSVVVDSVDALPEARALFGVGEWSPGFFFYQNQYVNVGNIRNQGWELQGSWNIGPLTTHGTYSWTKSRTIGTDPKYRAFFSNQPQYQAGATFNYLPEHTWGLGITYATAANTVTFNMTGTGQLTNFQDNFSFQNLSDQIRLSANRLNISNTGQYINIISGYAMADMTASHRIVSQVEGVLQIRNLGNRYTNDFDADYASLGRQVNVGFTVRLP